MKYKKNVSTAPHNNYHNQGDSLMEAIKKNRISLGAFLLCAIHFSAGIYPRGEKKCKMRSKKNRHHLLAREVRKEGVEASREQGTRCCGEKKGERGE